jgi:hypothetical protein
MAAALQWLAGLALSMGMTASAAIRRIVVGVAHRIRRADLVFRQSDGRGRGGKGAFAVEAATS